MKVYFIGAGPGAADLITLRGAHLLERCPVVMYAGSLVPTDVLTHCSSSAKIIDSSCLNLDEQTEQYKNAAAHDLDIARLHSGDPSIYGAIQEQITRLKELGITYEIVPGVSSFTAAAAALATPLTVPGGSQTIILTRASGRASSVPEKEDIGSLAQHDATMCIFLSGNHFDETLSKLREHCPEDTPVALVRRATWSDQQVHTSTLGALRNEIRSADWQLTTLLLVGKNLSGELTRESALYSATYSHRFRRAAKAPL